MGRRGGVDELMPRACGAGHRKGLDKREDRPIPIQGAQGFQEPGQTPIAQQEAGCRGNQDVYRICVPSAHDAQDCF